MLSIGTNIVWQAGITSMPQRCINLASLLSPIPAISPLSTSGGDFFDAISITTFPAPHVDGGEPLLLPALCFPRACAVTFSLIPWFAAPTIFSGSVDGRMRPHRATRPSDRLIHERAGKARSQNRQAGWHGGNKKDERERKNTGGEPGRGGG